MPALQRFVSWLGGRLTGDAGISLVNRQPVGGLIWARLSNSLILAGVVAAISVPLALTLGITAAVWRDSLYDRAVGVVTIAAVSSSTPIPSSCGLCATIISSRP